MSAPLEHLGSGHPPGHLRPEPTGKRQPVPHARRDAVRKCRHLRPGEETVHHSDQGSQYTAIAFGQRCKDAGVRPSMGSVGDCYVGAMCESFFATLECELIEREMFFGRSEARLAVFDYVEGFYNSHRLHSALDYQSPVTYEKEYFREQPLPSERLPPVAA